jgi:hypothetical protein
MPVCRGNQLLSTASSTAVENGDEHESSCPFLQPFLGILGIRHFGKSETGSFSVTLGTRRGRALDHAGNRERRSRCEEEPANSENSGRTPRSGDAASGWERPNTSALLACNGQCIDLSTLSTVSSGR